MDEIDTTNKFHVSAARDGSRIQIIFPPLLPLSVEDALTLAAWLVAVSGNRERFDEIYEIVLEACRCRHEPSPTRCSSRDVHIVNP